MCVCVSVCVCVCVCVCVVFDCNVLSIMLLMRFMNGTSPRQIRVYILMALANNYPCILV